MGSLEAHGKTVVCVAVDGLICGLIALRDAIRPESAPTIASIEAAGVRVWMLTGDNRTVANVVAEDLGIDPSRVLSELLPHQKCEELSRLQKEGCRVGMVGDGINDAPALAQADLGVAIGAGTDVAIEAADVVLCNSRLTDVYRAIDLSRTVFRRIRLNFIWALGFNVLGIPVAAGVLFPLLKVVLPPEVAGGAMAMSSVCVVSSSLLLRSYKAPTVGDTSRRIPFSKKVLPRILGAKSNVPGIDVGCAMARGGACTCDPDTCSCANCPVHSGPRQRRRSQNEVIQEERLGLVAGCAMQWGGPCSCDPTTCRCVSCDQTCKKLAM